MNRRTLLVRRTRAERELDAELRMHVDELTARYRGEGMSDDDARRRAIIEFGGLEPIKERCRDERPTAWLVEVAQDLRFGFRGIRRNPTFAATALIVIALGIGLNAATFSVVNAVLLRPLPLAHPEQLAVVWKGRRGARGTSGIAPANAIELPRLLHSGTQAAAFTLGSTVMSEADDGERVPTMRVSGDFFRILGAAPQLGRDFSREDDAFGAPRIAIISHALWTRRFAGDRRVVGQSVTLDNERYLVVGVMSERFRFPELFGKALRPDIWTPLQFSPREAQTRGAGYMFVLLRRAEDASWAQVQDDLDAASATFARVEPQTYTEHHLSAVPMREQVVRDVRTSLLIIWGAVATVLLIACANLANLLLARATVRTRELAVRASLGASRARLIRQLLTESVLLALSGTLIGVVLADVALAMLRSGLSALLPRANEIGLDLRVLALSAFAAVATGLVFGTLPAMQLSRAGPQDAMRSSSRAYTGTRASKRVRALLATGQIAMAFFLVTGAGLLVRSFTAVERVDLGLEPRSLLTADVALPANRYESARAAQFYDDVTARIEALPGVTSAAAMSMVPMSGGDFGWTYLVRDKPVGATSPLRFADVRIVTNGAFRTLAVPIREGRSFSSTDGPRARPVAVINEAMARSIWPGESALGKEIKLAGAIDLLPWMTVVGVVADVRFGAPDIEPRPAIYRPNTQHRWTSMAVVVRTQGNPLAAAPAVRAAIRSLDPTVPVLNVREFTDYLSQSVARRRMLMVLLTGFSLVALALALVGIYGLLAYGVAVRAPEIGVRVALGASRRGVAWLVMREALGITLVGLAIGATAGLLGARTMRTMVFGITAWDPVTFVVVALLVLVTALLASCLPAHRAATVDPLVTLRLD